MPTLDHVDGFELQVFNTTAFNAGGTQQYTTVLNASAETGTVKHGGGALKIAQAGTTAHIRRAVTAGIRTQVHSFYIRFVGGVPSGDLTVFNTLGPTNPPAIYFKSSTGKLALRFGTETGTDFGPVLSGDTWYLVDVKWDVSTATFTATAQVNGANGATHTRATQTAADLTFNGPGNNVSVAVTIDILYDSWVYGRTLGDYPFGEHQVLLLKPDGDGTHNAGTNVIEDQANADIGVVTAFDLINEVPPEATDYIQQSAAGSGNYAEVTFEDPTLTDIWGVTAWAVEEGEGTGLHDALFRMTDGSGTTLVDQGGAAGGSGTTRRYSVALVPDPGADGWTSTELSAVRARLGFATDVTPNPHFLTFILQYAAGISATVAGALSTATADAFAPTTIMGATIPAPLVTGTALALAPTLVTASGSISLDAPVATATGDALTPSLVTGATVTAPVATATGTALVPTLTVVSIIMAPLATATGAALVPTLVHSALIAAPVAQAVGQPSPPTAPNRIGGGGTGPAPPPPPDPGQVGGLGIVGRRRLSMLGGVSHVIMSPSGETDYPLIGEWEANEEAPGGFTGASGQVPERVVLANPRIYKYGSNWRTFHAETGECLWEGRLLDPELRGGVAQLQGRGLSERMGARLFQRLLFQNRDETKWAGTESSPFSRSRIDGFAEGPPSYWSFEAREGALMFKRTQNTGDSGNRMSGISGEGGFQGKEAFFLAPGVPDGGLQRLSFRLHAQGSGFYRTKASRDEDALYLPPNDAPTARTNYGVNGDGTGGTPTPGGTGVGHRAPYSYIDDGSWERDGIDTGREDGPACPQITISAGRLIEDDSADAPLWDINDILTIYPHLNYSTDFLDIDLHTYYSAPLGGYFNLDPGPVASLPDDRSFQHGLPGMTWGVHVPSAQAVNGGGGSALDGSLEIGEYDWHRRTAFEPPYTTFVYADPASIRIQRVDIIMITVADGVSYRAGNSNKYVFNDDPNTAVSVLISDISVDGLGGRFTDFAPGEPLGAGVKRLTKARTRMHSSDVVKEIANQLEMDDRFVQPTADNIMPLDFEGEDAGSALNYASLFANFRHRFLHTGTKAKLEFGPWGDRVWTINDDRQEMNPVPIERFDHVIVPFEYPGGQTDWVEVREEPKVLERRNTYGLVQMSDALHHHDAADNMAHSILEHLHTKRFAGDARLAEVVDENGVRRSAHHIHAGDVVRHTRLEGRARVKSLRRTSTGVELTFDESISAVERIAERRSKRLQRRH